MRSVVTIIHQRTRQLLAAVSDHAVETNTSFWFDVYFEAGLLGFEGQIFGRGLVS